MKKQVLYIYAILAILLSACSDNELKFDLFQVNDVIASAGDRKATIEWGSSNKRTPQEFIISWSADKNGIQGGSTSVSGESNSVVINELINDVSYTFYVQAKYDNGLSGKMVASCSPKSTRYDINNLLGSAGNSKVRLTWTKPDSKEHLGYRININPSSKSIEISDPNIERCIIDELNDGIEYSFSIICLYTNGESDGAITSVTPGNVSPITVASQNIIQNKTISFEYNDMYFIEDEIVSVLWNFGDGTTSTESKPFHSYTNPGDYKVGIYITYKNGNNTYASIDLNVESFKWSSINLINGNYTGFVKASNPVFSPDGLTAYIPTSNGKGDLFAIDIFSGNIKWVYPISGVSYGGGSIVGADGSIYQGAQDKKLYAIKPSGAEKWTITLEGNIEGFPAITSDQLLYVGTNSSSKATLYSINADNGSINWKNELEGSVISAIAVDKAGNIYAGTNKCIYSFFENGEQRWKTNGTINVTERGSFAINDNTLFAGLKAGAGLIAINMTDGTTLWKYSDSALNHDSYFPVIGKNGFIYYSNRSGNSSNSSVVALNKNGSKVWSQAVGGALIYAGAVISENNLIYIGTQSKVGENYLLLGINALNGTIEVTEPSTQQMMSAFTIAPDNRLYYGSVAGKLNAISINASLSSSWSVRGGNLQGTSSLK